MKTQTKKPKRKTGNTIASEKKRCERRRAALLGWMAETMEKFERVADELSKGGSQFGLVDDTQTDSAQSRIEDAIADINTAIFHIAGAAAKPEFLKPVR